MYQSIEEKIAQIQQEIRDTPYHKGTEHHIGRLKARIAKLKDELLEKQLKSKKGGGGGGGFALRHSGDASVALVGFPSVGKSTLLNVLTNAKSKVGEYDFTTLSVIPGMLYYQGAYIQLFDIPGLITGAAQGKGRGKEVLAVARSVNLVLLILSAQQTQQLQYIKDELHQASLRLDQRPPQITSIKKDKGGIIVHSNIEQSFSSQTATEVAKELGFRNAEITVKQKLTLDQLIDGLAQNRAYLPSLTVINKTDTLSPGKLNLLKKAHPTAIFISAAQNSGVEELKTAIWQKLNLIRIYLAKDQKSPDSNQPLIMHHGQTIKDVAEKISHDLADTTQLAKIAGPGAAFSGQKVPLTTPLQDQMIITLN